MRLAHPIATGELQTKAGLSRSPRQLRGCSAARTTPRSSSTRARPACAPVEHTEQVLLRV
eukprot:6197303-Pleurochrysis_carterae.AAC.1